MFWRLQVACVFIGAVIGAGFASGQEIWQFFGRYGDTRAVIAAGVLFSLAGPAVLFVCCRRSLDHYQDLLTDLFGRWWGRLMDGVITLSLGAGLIVMLAGSGALVWQQWGWPVWSGVCLTGGLLLVALWQGFNGLVWVNTVLVPVKALTCLGVATAVLHLGPVEVAGAGKAADWATGSFTLLPASPLLAAFLYVSFNLALALVVLVALAAKVKVKGGFTGAAAGGLVLGAAIYLLCKAMARYAPGLIAYPVPMLHLAGILHPGIGQLYAALLWLAMFTTALGTAFGVAWRVSGRDAGRQFRVTLTLTLLGVSPFALLPFAT
ncbi:MAG: hypothetical protein PHU78_06530, partial [Heliobacteriaceae bacterium]|nr:hypothetical protein [Heliobacteriaceae bacterium]